MKQKRNFLKSSVHNAALNIVLQVSFRCITFVLNAFVIRYVSHEAVGVMYVRLLLLESTILFLSREAFRKACLTKTTDHNWPQVINLIWITVPLCCVLSLVLGFIWMNVLSQPSAEILYDYHIGVWAIGLSCIIDMCAEPLYLIAQAFLFVKFRAVVDITSMILRSVIFATIVWCNPDKAVIAFSVAQILCIATYTSMYYGYFIYYTHFTQKELSTAKEGVTDLVHSDFPFHTIRDFLPKKLKQDYQIDWNLFTLTWSFFKQGVMMQILTEGERYIMTLLNVLSFTEQGIFDVVNNLGSLAARFIFRPIEESAYFYFTQLVHRNRDITKQDAAQMKEAAFVLECLLRTVTTIGILVLCFGQAYSALLLFIYGGERLALGLGTRLLRAHCLSILFLAINGIAEGYAFATMDTGHLNRYNRIMILFSIGFLFANWFLSYMFGSVGFIFANCCNMFARIFHSIYFIERRYQKTPYRPLRGIIPRSKFLCFLLVSTCTTLLSEAYFYEISPFRHLAIGVVCFVATVSCWVYEEQELIKYGVNVWKKKQE